MRKRWSSGGQDFCIVCACFVVVASACINASAQGHVVLTDSPAIAADVRAKAPGIKPVKQTDLRDRPVRRARGADELPRLIPDRIVKPEKKSVEGVGERRSKIKQENIAHDEIKKSADDVRQEARLIASEGQGITFERRIAKDQAAEWRRQLRYQLVGNVVRQQRIDDGLEEAKRAAREQARKVAEEAKSLTIRE